MGKEIIQVYEPVQSKPEIEAIYEQAERQPRSFSISSLNRHPSGILDQGPEDEPQISDKTKRKRIKKAKDLEKGNYQRGIVRTLLDPHIHARCVQMYGGNKKFSAFKKSFNFDSSESLGKVMKAAQKEGSPIQLLETAINTYEQKRYQKYPQLREYRVSLYDKLRASVRRMLELPIRASKADFKKARNLRSRK